MLTSIPVKFTRCDLLLLLLSRCDLGRNNSRPFSHIPAQTVLQLQRWACSAPQTGRTTAGVLIGNAATGHCARWVVLHSAQVNQQGWLCGLSSQG